MMLEFRQPGFLTGERIAGVLQCAGKLGNMFGTAQRNKEDHEN